MKTIFSFITLIALSAMLSLISCEPEEKAGFGNALKFDGINDYAIIDTTDFLAGASQISISFWAKLGDENITNRQKVLTKVNSGVVTNGFSVYFGDGGNILTIIIFTQGSQNYVKAECPVSNLIFWNHYGIYVDLSIPFSDSTNKIKMYVNGLQKNLVLFRGNDINYIGNSLQSMVIGSDVSLGGNEFLKGTLDELCFWSVASTSKIIDHYNSGDFTFPSTSNLYAFYRFNRRDFESSVIDEIHLSSGKIYNFGYNVGSGWVAH